MVFGNYSGEFVCEISNTIGATMNSYTVTGMLLTRTGP